MSCAELIYHHPQPLSSTFPYHHHHHGSQRSIAGDVYCNSSSSSSSSNYNNSSICSDYNGQVENEAAEDSTNTRMLHPLARQTSSSTAPPPPPLQSSNFTSRSASSSSSSPPSSSLGLLPHLPPPPHPPPLPHVSVTPPIHQHLIRGSSLASGSLAPCGGGGGRETQLQAPPPPSLHAALSSSPSSTSPLLTPSPPLSYFPTPISSSSSSSAFTSRAHTHGSSDPFLPAPVSSLFFPPPPPPSSSLSPASSYCSSSLKRRSSEAEEADDVPVPKKTRYVTSNCVMLTYHERDTSSEVDDHFSRALSSPGSSSSCGYGSGGTSRHSSTAESPPMSQRNFPPSFWDATHYLRQQHHYHHHYNPATMAGYNYPHQTATFTPHGAATASQTAGFFAGGAPHDPLYPLASSFLSGSLAMPSPFHTSFSSLHKDPWAGFPFSSGSKSAALNYYRYPRAGAYPDPHSAFSSSYGSSSSTEGSSGRFSSSASYGSLLLPSAASSMRGSGGYFPPSATITSAQSGGGGGELGTRMTPQGRETSRGVFAGSGSLSGPDSSAHEAGKDFHWY